MELQEKIDAIFPRETDIPAEFRISAPIHQDVYLVNGELKTWDGPWQEVVSPVNVANGAGLAPKVLGRYPLMDTATAQEILGAAIQAYDAGRGLWPTMSVPGTPSAYGGICLPFPGEAGRRSPDHDVGNRQVPAGFGQRVRPHRGLRERYH